MKCAGITEADNHRSHAHPLAPSAWPDSTAAPAAPSARVLAQRFGPFRHRGRRAPSMHGQGSGGSGSGDRSDRTSSRCHRRDFQPGRFDLVHARFVLMHLPSPERMIATLSRPLAPGGVLVIGDAVDLTTADAPDTPYTPAMRAMWRGLRDTIGTDVSLTPRHPGLLKEAGLRSVAAGDPCATAPAGQRDQPLLGTDVGPGAAGHDRHRPRRRRPHRRGRALPGLSGCADLSPGMLTGWGRSPHSPRTVTARAVRGAAGRPAPGAVHRGVGNLTRPAHRDVRTRGSATRLGRGAVRGLRFSP